MPCLEEWFEQMPVVAILRGVKPGEVVEIGMALHGAGIGIIEVALNSPEPLASITALNEVLGDTCVVGAGTVVQLEDVDNVANAGGRIIVAPNTDAAIIQRSLELGLTPMPGWATATEVYTAYAAGARYLKLFPASIYGPGHVKAIKALLPADARFLAVGGIGAEQASIWMDAGVHGFGVGTELYVPGLKATEVAARTQSVVNAIELARAV